MQFGIPHFLLLPLNPQGLLKDFTCRLEQTYFTRMNNRVSGAKKTHHNLSLVRKQTTSRIKTSCMIRILWFERVVLDKLERSSVLSDSTKSEPFQTNSRVIRLFHNQSLKGTIFSVSNSTCNTNYCKIFQR
jgi:hypothetical protein